MVSVSLAAPSELPANAAVLVGVHSGELRLAPGAGPVDTALGGRLLAALRAVGATGKPDQVVKIPTLGVAPFPLVVATGLGDDGLDPERVRRGVGAAVRALASAARLHVAI